MANHLDDVHLFGGVRKIISLWGQWGGMLPLLRNFARERNGCRTRKEGVGRERERERNGRKERGEGRKKERKKERGERKENHGENAGKGERQDALEKYK